eukprot:TRINITY_DN6407_c0_g1_i5.p2 TRINITY_DN6407_c0_g1~~TRINITY_DN6407_c0_g1_i5.p2  ORF type:complete len:109 (-),score=7.72 TRINITY_DN6407_c0_g1_i5:80-406(-)
MVVQIMDPRERIVAYRRLLVVRIKVKGKITKIDNPMICHILKPEGSQPKKVFNTRCIKLDIITWYPTKVPYICLLYTSDAADDTPCVDLGGRRIIKKKKRQESQSCSR